MIDLADTSPDTGPTGTRVPYVSSLDDVRAVSILPVSLVHVAPSVLSLQG